MSDKETDNVPATPRTVTREELERALQVIRMVGSVALEGAAADPPTEEPEGPPAEKAYETFLRDLRVRLGDELWANITVTDQRSWVQLAGPSDRVYVAKSATVPPRVECTLEPEMVEGAQEPIRRNGRIRSLLPPDVEAVAQAITIIAADRQ